MNARLYIRNPRRRPVIVNTDSRLCRLAHWHVPHRATVGYIIFAKRG